MNSMMLILMIYLHKKRTLFINIKIRKGSEASFARESKECNKIREGSERVLCERVRVKINKNVRVF